MLIAVIYGEYDIVFVVFLHKYNLIVLCNLSNTTNSNEMCYNMYILDEKDLNSHFYCSIITTVQTRG
jgi:hypothetical protein